MNVYLIIGGHERPETWIVQVCATKEIAERELIRLKAEPDALTYTRVDVWTVTET